MSAWENPYTEPEKFDLDPIAELELDEPCYSFNTVVVWRHLPSGKLYWAHDAGCSCPVPFEDYDSVEELTPLVDYDELARYVSEAYDQGAKMDFLREVREAM